MMNLDGAFESLAIALIVIGIALGFVVFEVIPWLWALVRPWLHFITASI